MSHSGGIFDEYLLVHFYFFLSYFYCTQSVDTSTCQIRVFFFRSAYKKVAETVVVKTVFLRNNFADSCSVSWSNRWTRPGLTERSVPRSTAGFAVPILRILSSLKYSQFNPFLITSNSAFQSCKESLIFLGVSFFLIIFQSINQVCLSNSEITEKSLIFDNNNPHFSSSVRTLFIRKAINHRVHTYKSKLTN